MPDEADEVEDGLRHVVRDAVAARTRRAELWDGAAGSLACTGPLAVGAVAGDPAAGLTAGLGALNVALATPPATRREQLRWGGLGLVGTTLAAGLGAAVGGSATLHVVVTFVLVGSATSLRRAGPRGALLGFVISAVYVIVSGLPGHEQPVVEMARFAAGGVVALGLLLAVSRPGREPASEAPVAALPGTVLVAHGLRVAVAVTVATLVGEAADLRFAYWVPLTTLAVLQPDHRASVVRALQRCLGTVVGVAVVAAVTVATAEPSALIPLVGVSSFVLFALRERSYYWVVVALTPTALLMISTDLDEGWVIAEQRLVDTLIGVAIALAATGLALLAERHVPALRTSLETPTST